MGFAAAAPIIAAGISATSSAASSGKGGGKGGGSSKSADLFQQTENFAPFQREAIGQLFSALEGGEGSDLLLGGTGRDHLLQVPPKVSGAVGEGLDFARSLLGSDNAPFQDLLNFESGIDLAPRFADAIDRFEEIGNRAGPLFAPFVSGAQRLGEEGADPRFADILFDIANEDPNSNPFVDRLVGDVSADIRANVIDQNVAAGLESSGFGQQLARETGRAATDIRERQFRESRNRSATAADAGGRFSIADEAGKISAFVAGSNFLNQRFGVELGAAGGVLSGTQAEESLRLAKQKAIFDSLLARTNLPLAGLGSIGSLANQFQELPFKSAADFAALVGQDLGSTTVRTGFGNSSSTPGLFDTAERIAGLGLTGAGILDEAGVFDSGGSGGGGTSQVAGNVGTSLIGTGSPFTSPTRFFPGDPIRPDFSSLFT